MQEGFVVRTSMSKNGTHGHVDALSLGGDWSHFVASGSLSLLRKRICESDGDVHICFGDIRVSIVFMLFVKQCLEDACARNVYLYNYLPVANLLSFLDSDNYSLHLENIPFDASGVFVSDHVNLSPDLNDKDSVEIPLLYHLGKWLFQFYASSVSFCNFVFAFLYYLLDSVFHPSKFKLGSLFFHIREHGLGTLPIGLLVGIVVGYAATIQVAVQLSNLGAPVLISIDTTAKLSLHEMGPFILAIIVAGRSGSSFTAQISSMRLTNELSAMQVMNLNIFHYLVIPRVLALCIAMPLMIFVVDIFCIFGSMIALHNMLGIGFEQYVDRFYEDMPMLHFLTGLLKGPFFGIIIGMIGCFRGVTCSGGTQSIGRCTTMSLVNSMFWIILVNALLSIISVRFGM